MILQKIIHWLGRTALYFFIASVVSVILYRFVPVFITPLMLIRCVQQTFQHKDIRLFTTWKPLDEMSPMLPLAVVASEDQNYMEHSGFDIKAIEKAMKYNATHKKKRGASTISQQTAKNVFLWPSRSWVRKAFEFYFTALIEIFWSKKRIMEVYLNVIEMGDGIYGAEAAAQTYFQRSAQQLTPAQCAAIASILPSPMKYRLNHPPVHVVARQQWILRQMKNLGGELKWEK